jgi:hypothetical protein
MPKSHRVSRHQTEDPKRIRLAIEVGEMPAAGASQQSRSDSWKRRRRSAPNWIRDGGHPESQGQVATRLSLLLARVRRTGSFFTLSKRKGLPHLALAGALGGERAVAADDEPLTRELGRGDAGHVAVIEQRHLQCAAVEQCLDCRGAQGGDPVEPADLRSSVIRAWVIMPRSPTRTKERSASWIE